MEYNIKKSGETFVTIFAVCANGQKGGQAETAETLTFRHPCLVLVALLRGYRAAQNHRWQQACDNFYTNMMFFLFIIYPVVSISTMRAFNCDSNLGLLKVITLYVSGAA